MKRLVVLLLLVMILVTGCSVTTLSNNNIGSNIKTLLSEKTNMYNAYFDGYKYYVPYGMTYLIKDDYNASFVDRYGNKYYLYVDAISYYHKVENTYKEKDDSYYSKKLDYNKKTGYIQIDKKEDGYYLIQYMYNYSKMEAYVKEKDIVNVVDNMSCILRSVKFNRKILESLIGENILSYKEEEFNLFDTNSNNVDFMDVVSKYEDEDYTSSIEDEFDLD